MAGQTETAPQPAPAPSSKALFNADFEEEQRLRASLSPEAFQVNRINKWARFNELCEETSRRAEANGLTEEILAEILAED
jgi:hypothetical protein